MTQSIENPKGRGACDDDPTLKAIKSVAQGTAVAGGTVGGGCAGGGTGAAVGFLVAGPAGAAVGWLIGLGFGAATGAWGGNKVAKHLLD